MSCPSDSSSYSIKAGDNLFDIAAQKLGDGNRWWEIKKPDGTPFTEDEAKNLQPGQEICLPIRGGTTTKGGFRDFLEALGRRETGLPSGDPNQYKVENSLGFIGKYQFGEPLLIDLGYYIPKDGIFFGNGADKNFWRGTWTGKKGIDSKSKFLNSPDVQEFAVGEEFTLNWKRINDTLRGQGKSIDNFLGKEKIFIDRGVSKTVTISLSGILAGAHLRGANGLADLLLKDQVSADEFGTSILEYMSELGGYDVSPADF